MECERLKMDKVAMVEKTKATLKAEMQRHAGEILLEDFDLLLWLKDFHIVAHLVSWAGTRTRWLVYLLGRSLDLEKCSLLCLSKLQSLKLFLILSVSKFKHVNDSEWTD